MNESTTCAYCGTVVDGTRPPPEPDDGYGWLLEALDHKPGFEWATTRGFLFMAPELPLQPEEVRDHGVW